MVLGTALSLGAIFVIAGAILLLYRFIGNPRKKDMVLGVGIVALVAGFLMGGATIVDELQGMVRPAAVSGVDAQQITVPTGAVCDRQTDGTNTLNTVYRNVENSSLGYLATSVTAEVDGESKSSGTTTAGSSLSYLALNVPPCEVGKIYSLQASDEASSVVDYSSYTLTSEYEIKGAAGGVVSLLGRDSTLTACSNVTVIPVTTCPSVTRTGSGVGTTDKTVYFRNNSFDSGSSLNFYLDYSINGTATAFGAMVNGQPASDGVIFSLDTVDASKWSTNSMSLTSDTAGIALSKVACPSSVAANRNAEVCWKSRTLLASDGEIRVRGTLKADLGDPTASGDSPILCVDDNQYFRDTDGDVKYDAFDSSGTNKGIAGTCIQFSAS